MSLPTIEAAEDLPRIDGRGVWVSASKFLVESEDAVDADEYLVKLEQGGFAIMCQSGSL